MEGKTNRRFDGLIEKLRHPVLQRKAKRFGAITIAVLVLVALIGNGAFPRTILGETGSTSATRLWSSGAELNSTANGVEVTSSSGTKSISSSTVRSGTYSYRANPTSSTGIYVKQFASSNQSAKFWFREYIRIATTPSATTYVMRIGNSGGGKISVKLTTSNTLQFYNEEDSANIGSASSALSTGTWYRLEAYVDTTTLSTTSAEMRLDGASIASSTSENLAAGIDRMSWGSMTSGTTDLFFDDIAINNASGRSQGNWPGEGKIVHLKPNGNGDNTAWTGDYTDVDEVTPDDGSTAISSATNGQLEDDNIEDSSTPGIGANDTVKLVQVGQRYQRCDAGLGGPGSNPFSPKKIANYFVGKAYAAVPSCPLSGNNTNNTHRLRIKASASGTVEESSNITDTQLSWITNDNVVGNYALTLYDLPGSSTAPWKPSDLDSAQIGVNMVTADPQTNVSTLWLLVEYVPKTGGRLISSGFELNSSSNGMEFTTSAGSPSINNSTFNGGAYSLETANSGAQEYVRFYFESANTNNDYYARAYLRIATGLDATTATVLSFLDTSNLRRAYIKLTTSNTLELWDEDGQIGSASSALSTSTWYRVELRMNTSPSAGSHVVDGKIDGTSFASSSSRSIGTGIARIGMGINASESIESSANTQGDLLWDDVAVNKAVGTSQNSWPGAGKIVHLRPSADDSTNTAWTNGFANVDEVTPNDATDLVSETTSDDIDDYDIDNASLSGTDTVNLVSVGVRFNTSSATQEDFRVRLKDSSSGIAIESNTLSPASTTWTTNATADPKLYPLTAYTLPEQSTAWTDTTLDSAQIGLRDVLSSTGTVQVTAEWLLVDYTEPQPISISGICKQYDQSTDCTDDGSNEIAVAVNGTLQGQVDTTVDGSWSITGVTAPASGDIITIFINGETTDNEEANAVTKYDGTSDITGVVLYYRHLTIGSDDNQTITNSNLSSYDNSVSSDEDIFFDVDAGNDLVVDTLGSYTDEELYTVASNTFRPASGGGADVSTVHVENDGTWTADSNTINVSGNWQNDGTFTAGTSTLNMTSTTTGRTLSGTMTSSSAFYDLIFNGSGGAWSFSAAATVGRDFTITNGTVTAPSGNLTVARDFTVNGAFTHNSGTVVLNTTTTGTISTSGSGITFNNVTSTTANKTIQFKHHTTGSPVITFAGQLTLTGTSGNLINLYSDSSGTQWKAHFNSSQTNMTYVNLRDGGCDTGTSNAYMDATSTSVSNNDTCWIWPINRLWSGGAELQSSTAGVETNFNDGTVSVNTTTKRSGAASWRVSNSSSAFNKYFVNTPTQGKYWARVYVYIHTAPSAQTGIIRFNGSATRVGVRINTDRTLELWDEDGTAAKIGSSSSALTVDTWYRVELYADSTTLSSTAVELRLDGSSVASGTFNMSAAFDRIQWGILAGVTGDFYFDDIAVNGNSSAQSNWPGDGKIVHMKPNADGDNTAWTGVPSDTNDYDDVDEVTPNGDTDYILSTAVNTTEDLDLESSSTAGIAASSTINVVSVGVRLKDCNSGGPACFAGSDTYAARLKASSGGTTDQSGNIAAQDGSNYMTHSSSTANLYSLTEYYKPGTTAAWTNSDLDTAQAGVKHTTNSNGYRVTTIWLLVDYTPPPSITVEGLIYSDEGSTLYNCSSDNLTVNISINGAATETTTCTTSGGVYSLTTTTLPSAAGDPIVVGIDSGETPKATTATLAAGTTTTISGLNLYQNRVIVRHEDSGPITNSKLNTGDNGDAGFRYSVSSGNLTTEAGMKLLVWTGKTFTPGGTVTTTTGSSPSGDVGIQSSATLSMGGNALSIGGSYSNSGTFTSSSNTTTFTSTSTGKTLAGTMTSGSAFYNLTFNGVSGGWTFNNAVAATNDFSVTNGAVADSSNSLTVTRDLTLSNTSGVSYTASSSTITVSRDWNDTGNKFVRGSSAVVLNGTGNLNTTGAFTDISIGYSTKTTTLNTSSFSFLGTMTLNGGTVNSSTSGWIDVRRSTTGTSITFASPTTLSGTRTLYMRNEANSITQTIPAGDYGTWSIDPFVTSGSSTSSTYQLGGAITTTGTLALEATTGATGSVFNTQNNNITASSVTFGPESRTGSWTFNMGSSTVTVSNTSDAFYVTSNGGSHTLNLSSGIIDTKGNVKFVNGTGTASVSAGTSLVRWTNTSGTKTYSPNGQTLYDVTLNGSGGSVQPDAAVIISDDLTMTAGSLIGTQDITVNGNVAGTAGIINLTGGTFEQRISANKNFGTTSGSTAWTFSSLTFSNGNGGGVSRTVTTQTGGTGDITVSSILRIGKSGDGVGDTTTLNAGNRLWTLSGTAGDPFQILSSPSGTLTPSTSTYYYKGANGSGNTTVEKSTSGGYNSLTIGCSGLCSADTYELEGNTTVASNLVINSSSTLDAVSGQNYNLTVAGNLTNSGTFTARNNTVTLNGTSTQTLSGTWSSGSAFYDLTITNSSGASASDCERTGFTASVDYNVAVTATHNYTITTANVRIEYNTATTYTFSNINWNGQASGSRIYFRNSAASGTWLLNVSGTQTAVSYVNVSRSDASSGNQILANDGTNVDCNNNTNWLFNTAPNTPTSLVQKRVTAGTTISTGDWTNETQVTFEAQATDTDNPDTLYLCVEKDDIFDAFSNTEDLCGSGVAYSGSAVTVSVTITGQTDATQYHWQARVKDSGGSYSSWAAYGGNSDVGDPADVDYGIDTTACTYGSSIYDGTVEDVDAVYNDGSLTSLSANWDAFTCGVSGLNKYEYSIGTTAGGTDIKTWTNNSTNDTVTATSLVLHTNQHYYVNVRATDNAANVSTTYSSNGQDVLPIISMSLSGSSITFAELNAGNNRSDTKTVTTTSSTNAYGGYIIRQYASGLLTGGISTIPMFEGGTYASPSAWGSLPCSSGSNCGYGYTSNDTTIQGSNLFGSGTLYASFATSAFGDIVADHTAAVDGSSGAVSGEQFTITHKVAVDSLQPAKSYTTSVYYIITGTF